MYLRFLVKSRILPISPENSFCPFDSISIRSLIKSYNLIVITYILFEILLRFFKLLSNLIDYLLKRTLSWSWSTLLSFCITDYSWSRRGILFQDPLFYSLRLFEVWLTLRRLWCSHRILTISPLVTCSSRVNPGSSFSWSNHI